MKLGASLWPLQWGWTALTQEGEVKLGASLWPLQWGWTALTQEGEVKLGASLWPPSSGGWTVLLLECSSPFEQGEVLEIQ